MNHTDTSCNCGAAVSPLALRWRCPVCLWQDFNSEGVDWRCDLRR